MPAIFSQRTGALLRAVLVASIILVVAVPVAAMLWVRTPLARGEGVRISQPIPFSHPIHVTGLGIDCRYCHAGAERSAAAGVPSTRQCVPCHTDTWLESAPMRPLRASLASGAPIPWARVTQLPDFVYFNHAMHVTNGVGCETCHGRIDQMAEVKLAVPLTMSWCVDCHRDPAPQLRPVTAVTAMGWHPDTLAANGTALRVRYDVRRLTNCTTCHR